MNRRFVSRAATVAVLSATALLLAPPAASAAPGEFTVDVDPQPTGAATATLVDTLMPSNRYLVTLTSAGTGTCDLTGPTVQIADYDVQGYGNPVVAHVDGACSLYNAAVTYLVTWSGLPGSSGQVPVHCTWASGVMQCSPSEFTIVVP